METAEIVYELGGVVRVVKNPYGKLGKSYRRKPCYEVLIFFAGSWRSIWERFDTELEAVNAFGEFAFALMRALPFRRDA